MRKIAIISGNGGSGGLIGYIKGILSADVVPENTIIKFYCRKNLVEKIGAVVKNVEICITNDLNEKGKEIVFGKRLSNRFIKMVDNFCPDVVFFVNGYIRKGLEEYPNVMVLHNQLYIDKKQFWREGLTINLLKRLLFRRCVINNMHKADGVLFLSNFSMNQTLEYGHKIKNAKVIPFGFEDENRIDKVLLKPVGNPIKFIYISAIYPYKNHKEIVKGLSKLKEDGLEIELHFVGSSDKKTLKKLYNTIKDRNMEQNVVFHNWVDHDKIKNYIDNMDIFVYASSIETTGYGLLEGMARGACIISSNQSGFDEILDAGGVYFDPENIDSIYQAAKKIISDEQLRKECANKAFINSAHYSWEKAASNLYKFLLSFIKDKENY